MQFDGRGANTARGFDLTLIGVDEQRHFGADLRQAFDRRPDPRFLSRHVQSAFGGQLLTGFGHQADMRRADAFGELHHFFGDAHFEVHAGLQHILEHQNVALLNVPAVFAQVHGDAVSARLFRVQRCLDRVRITGAPGLTQGGNVVDVHAKKNTGAGGHGKRSRRRESSVHSIHGEITAFETTRGKPVGVHPDARPMPDASNAWPPTTHPARSSLHRPSPAVRCR
ncbi:hypothetical protein D3C71_1268060 [compost metagenome]